MRVLLSTYGSRGDFEPMMGLAVRFPGTRRAGAGVCAPPEVDFANRLAGVDVPLISAGQPAKASAIAAAAQSCDALVTTGMMPAAVDP